MNQVQKLHQKKVLAIVPARGGSKGIPRKNIREFAGKPLISYTAEAAIAAQLVDRIILSTDDEEIASIGQSCGLEVPFMRPKSLAADDTPALPVILHAVQELEKVDGYRPDYILLLQATSPFRRSHHIDEALEILLSSKADSIVSVLEVPHTFNPYSLMQLEDGKLEHFLKFNERDNLRQKKPVFYARNGAAIYAFSYDCLFGKNSIYGDYVLPYFMKKEESIDLDDMWDWKLAELIIRNGLLEDCK